MSRHQRVWHYLPGNKRSSVPSNLIFADTETVPDNTSDDFAHTQHRLRLWHGIALRIENGRVTRRVSQKGTYDWQFWEWVSSRCNISRPTWLWFHNASYDLQALSFAREVDSGRVRWQTTKPRLDQSEYFPLQADWQGLVVVDNPPTIIELRIGDTKKKLLIVDTLNYWRCSLRELGESVGIPKWPMPEWSAPDEEWQAYCERDCEIVEKAVLTLIQTVSENDLGNFRYTAPAQGIQAFRHRFMDHKILVHCDENALRLERQSYFGGQCRVYRGGTIRGPVHVLDVNSFYPSLMSRYPVPYHLRGSLERPPVAPLAEIAKRFYCIAEVGIKSDTVAYPVRHRGRNVMAKGKFKTTLHHPELVAALNNHHINGVYAVSWYSSDVLFKRFVTELWALRQKSMLVGDVPQANMIKLIMNGVHGKFGQKQIKWIDEPTKYAPIPWGMFHEIDGRTGETHTYRSLCWRVQRKREIGENVNSVHLPPADDKADQPSINDESVHSCPAIAGSITAWGRFALAELISIAGPDNVYYTDTDCLHVNLAGYQALAARQLIARDELGKLSIKKVAQQAEYRGPKHYRLDDDWTIAGVKESAERISLYQYRQVNFTNFPSVLYKGIDGGLWQIPVDVNLYDAAIDNLMSDDGTIDLPTIVEEY